MLGTWISPLVTYSASSFHVLQWRLMYFVPLLLFHTATSTPFRSIAVSALVQQPWQRWTLIGRWMFLALVKPRNPPPYILLSCPLLSSIPPSLWILGNASPSTHHKQETLPPYIPSSLPIPPLSPPSLLPSLPQLSHTDCQQQEILQLVVYNLDEYELYYLATLLMVRI